MMEKVYFVEDGLGYGERAVFGLLSLVSVNDTVYVTGGISKMAEDFNINKGSLLRYLRLLENKGYISVSRRELPRRVFIADIKLHPRKVRKLKVPRSFLFTGSPKERGLLITLMAKVKGYKSQSGKGIKKTAFYLNDLSRTDAKSPKTLRKLINNLQNYGFIFVEKTRPFYVIRVIA